MCLLLRLVRSVKARAVAVTVTKVDQETLTVTPVIVKIPSLSPFAPTQATGLGLETNHGIRFDLVLCVNYGPDW